MQIEPNKLAPFAARLVVARRHYGTLIGNPSMKCAAFATRHLGIEAARYRRYERGEMEPPLEVLRLIRIITGISLDWLVAGMSNGMSGINMTSYAITVGNRLKWAREISEPFMPSCAAVMGVPASLWGRYETDLEPFPITVATEFAHRFAVSLDYLFRGQMTGIAPVVLVELLRRHPELGYSTNRDGTDTDRDDDNRTQSRKSALLEPRRSAAVSD